MKTINAKLITLGLAAVLLAACSDNTGDNPADPGDGQVLGTEVVSITDAQQLANRVLNFKAISTKTTRAAGATAADLGDTYSMPAKPSVPSDAIEIKSGGSVSSTQGLTYGKSYVIKKGTKIASGLNLNGADLYVEGELDATACWSNGCSGYWDSSLNSWVSISQKNGNIYVLGGKVTLDYNPGQDVFNSSCLNLYNYGGTVIDKTVPQVGPHDFYISSNCGFYTDSDINFGDKTLKIQGKFYCGGNLTVKEFLPVKGGVANIQGDLLGLENKTVEGTVQDETHKGLDGLINIGGKFNCKNLALGSECKLYACSINITGTLTLTSNELRLHANHIKAGNIMHMAAGKILLVNNSVIECDKYTTNSNGASSVQLEGNGAVAVFKAGRIQFNGSSTTDIYAFNSTGAGSQILVDCPWYDFLGHENAGEDVYNQTYEDITWHGGVENGVTQFNNGTLALKPAECGYTIDPKDTPKEPEKILDPQGELQYDHNHNISATCIQPYNGKLYMSYHTRGTGHGGCLEVFQTDAQNQTSLLQYLEDKEHNLDFNHLIIDGKATTPRLYAVGNSFKKGAMLATIDLKSDGLMNTDVKQIDENTAILPLTVVALDKNATKNNPQDENCIVRDGDKFLVMSTRGYEVYDTGLNLLGSKKTPGKAKHIAINGSNMATLYYDGPVADTIQANGVIEEFSAGDDILTATPKKTIAVGRIAPNNGKNTIAIDGNNLYVCRGAEGLTCYDRTSGTAKWTWTAPLTADTKVVQGNANGVTFDDKYIYLACGGYGVVVFDKNTMVDGKPKVIAKKRAEKRNSANYVTLNNGLIYVAYGKSRLQVFKLTDAPTKVKY